jgi:hypothetical protein
MWRRGDTHLAKHERDRFGDDVIRCEQVLDEPQVLEGSEDNRAIAETPESVTSQSRHSLTLSGSPPHDELLI